MTGNHSGQIGPGFTVQVAEGVSLFANFDFLFGEHDYSNTGSGGVLFFKSVALSHRERNADSESSVLP